MEKVKKLGDLFPAKNVPESELATPSEYDSEVSEKLFRESEARMLKEQKFNSARNCRKLFTRLTGEELDIDTEQFFSIMEEEFGKVMVLEAVEYMVTRNLSWEVGKFKSYLLKSLQTNHTEANQGYEYKSPEDLYLDDLDKATARQTRRHLMEIRKWERQRKTGKLDVSTAGAQ